MRINRLFHRYTVGALPVTAAVLGALLFIGGPANAAPTDAPGGALHSLSFPPPSPDTNTATSTSLKTSPASPVPHGTRVTLTATVIPATAAGAVQFKDGTKPLGKPVRVSNGIASGTTSMLSGESHLLTAAFTPDTGTAYRPSTAPPLIFQVTDSTSSTGSTSGAPPVNEFLPIGSLLDELLPDGSH